ncbi:nonribosomal peptide synthase, variant 2 [Blastomyces gilchristii SLH14081]|uniref:Nonribosomal peptide synthase n=1 Tax=Blastomyces gilchristii (strain SLH14081) TaxID=559298 RepID=A0A179U850_BLAGS|nr:nonribosomal peptide synthase, variant 1 [Blastomyces gilchristii SLH14081]XP_031575669.1 nonribosomal peptide synthase [Blastomyces gilchristii SLH14081]XP_031575670.1 nonribosomal peptide synthase, variant 2 [Blastomyces gilchristii SLH14081]OAT03487.1 nonribosomal peptide synthase [Blastomyces gilchristii SLH14081]OAT03488.1 nonribosomal peptide synthase, variant 1 [Blastomyces gilchristii SLH14081]OAT03489.1 nonribosomal peptide synthase, variant 2 [Blastomyces gilchristii SLH14081]
MAISELQEESECTEQQRKCLSRSPHGNLPTYTLRWDTRQLCPSIDRLVYTWQAVASHNPVLRTSIKYDGADQEPRLVVLRRATPIRIQGISDHGALKTASMKTAELTVALSETGVTLRLRIFQVLVDRRSLALISRDFDLFYHGLSCEPHGHFKYYMRHITERDSQSALSYWRNLMNGTVTSLSYGFPTKTSGMRNTLTSNLHETLVKSIHEFLNAHAVSMRDFIHAIWSLVQYRHTAATDGTSVFAVTGRDTSVPGYDTIVGHAELCFPLKVVIENHLSLLSWIRKVSKIDQQSSRNAFIGYSKIQHQIYPLDVQVRLIVSDALDILEEGDDDILFPLTINIDLGRHLVNMHYYSEGSGDKDLQVILGHFISLVNEAVQYPNALVSDMDILPKEEKEFLLQCSKPVTFPVAGLIHGLFEYQAELNPQHECLNFEGQTAFTYEGLNGLSNQVARQLTCGRGDYVPVCMDRSPELIVSILAILKTGAAYVILDPESPPERNSFIVNDVQAPFVISDQSLAVNFANPVLIENLIERAPGFALSNIEVPQDTTDICYVIYTSGSTGKPKGVLLEHKSAYTGLMAFPTLPNLRQLLFHNPIFSAAQRSIFSTLKQGGCLCLARKENLTVRITDMINSMRVNVIDVTPSTAALIDQTRVPTLRRMTVAGELINPALLPVWMGKLELLNAYGLSEVTQINWRHVMQPKQNPQNIGRPVDSTRSYVLVPGTVRLAAILEPGELCLGGQQLARSYLNRPERTRESFIKNPFGPGRLYRTGDMVVTHADGRIEMIGRIDFQVKINGQRVEPGEVNCYIQQHPDVYDSWTVSTTMGSQKSLVAVVVPRGETEWPTLVRNLQKILRDLLPSYMVPAYWWKQSHLPLNVNGKVDVPQLCRLVQAIPPEKMLVNSTSANQSIEQCHLTPMESSLRRIWAEVLCIPETSINLEASFLNLGGSSLSAIIAASRASKELIDVKVHNIMLQNNLLEVASTCKRINNPVVRPEAFSLLPKDYIAPNEIEDAWLSTPSQEPLIADVMLDGAKYVYDRVVTLKNTSIGEVKAALKCLLKTDTFLRSTFTPYGRTYIQTVPKKSPLPWQDLDMTLAEYLEKRPVTITMEEPFFKVTVLTTGELIFTMHHALFDFWSNRFVFDDLSNLIRSRPPVSRPQYNQFVQYLTQQDRISTQEYWRNYLRDSEPSSLGHTSGPNNVTTVNLTTPIYSTSKAIGVSVGSILYASWALVLSLILGKPDVIFGITLFGRDVPIPDILLMEGPTVVQVPLRVKISKSSTIGKVAKEIHRQIQSVAEHAHFGLRNILLAAGQPAGLFDTSVNFLVKPPSSDADDTFTFVSEEHPGFTDFIKLEACDSDLSNISLSSTLDSSFAQNILSGLGAVFNAFSFDAQALVGDLKLSSMLPSTSQPPTPKPLHTHSQFAHSLFEHSVSRFGDKTALVDENRNNISYKQLNEQANRLANFLRSRAILPEDVIPICLDKSINMIIAILGVFKAGAAICALDPAGQSSRNQFILKKVKAKLIVTDLASSYSLENFGYEYLLLDQLDLSQFSCENFVVTTLCPENLAYVIFTSGSTGDPKGVLVTHDNVFHATKGIMEATKTDDSWRSLWALNYIFDGSYSDLFTVLSAGGTLCLVSQARVFSNLAGFINNFDVTHISLTPTIVKKLLIPSDVPSLKALIVGGEPLVPEILNDWAARIPVYNSYGPTEGTITATTALIEPNSKINNIGTALSTTIVSILEFDSETPVALGEVGEFCLGGPQVARGYLDGSDVDNTAFSVGNDGSRIYRTGDVARQLPSGQIELFGRRDNQVKVNGYRIELGEIENAILRTGMLKTCVVLAAKIHGKTQLAAVCQLLSEAPGDIGRYTTPLLPPSEAYPFQELQTKMGTLARYMIPAVWLPVTYLPLLPSGKTNRKEILKLVESMEDSLVASYQDVQFAAVKGASDLSAPESAEERLLRNAWASIFKCDLDSFGTTSSFYSLGGDSITAINLVSECRKLGYELAVADVLSFPSIKEQARVMRPLPATNCSLPAFPHAYEIEDDIYDTLHQSGVDQNDIEAIYPCVPGQVEFLTQGHTDDQFWQLQTVRRVPSDFDVERWLDLVRKLTEKNAILRAMFVKSVKKEELPKWVQVILKEAILDLETICYDTPEDRERMINTLWDGRFKVGKPFIQYRILRSTMDGTLDLYIKMDHAMYDGTLLRIFDDQFIAMVKNEEVPKPTEFTELIRYCSTSDTEKMLKFWVDLLDGNRFDYSSQSLKPKVGGMLFRAFGIEVNDFAHSSGITVPIVFQTAWGILLSFLSSSFDVTYDNLLTGRNVNLDNPQLINGNCANFLPFRTRFQQGKTLRTLLHDTQMLFWETTENGMVGLADIYKALGVDRSKCGAKTIFCFQPFDPPPKTLDAHMRWIVMGVSQNRMFFNYSLMCEVFKSPTGYKTKFQYDPRFMDESATEKAADTFVSIFNFILGCTETTTVGNLYNKLNKDFGGGPSRLLEKKELILDRQRFVEVE